MNAETVHAFALLSLRALADHDPFEFRRTTDLSKRELDHRIERLLEDIGDEPEAGEIRRQMSEVKWLVDESENEVALNFLLRQMSAATLQHAHTLAINYARISGPRPQPTPPPPERHLSPAVAEDAAAKHEQYLRLSIMRLLRRLPDYNPVFHFRWKGQDIDCVLEPASDELPPVIVEFKLRLPAESSAKDVFRRLNRIGSGWGKGTLFAMIVADGSSDFGDYSRRLIPAKFSKRTFVLFYDVERNEFSRESEGPLVHTIRER